jgi:alpha-glucuronidase
MKRTFLFFLFCFSVVTAFAGDGYDLWLRYKRIDDPVLLQQYRDKIKSIQFTGNSLTQTIAKKELLDGLKGLLAISIIDTKTISDKSILAGTSSTSAFIQSFLSETNINLGDEGFIITTKERIKKCNHHSRNWMLESYMGVFQFLRLLQTHQSISHSISQAYRAFKTAYWIIGII